MMEASHVASEQVFASIGRQLARLVMQPRAPFMQSPEPYQVSHHAVLLLKQGAPTVGSRPPPVPPPLTHVYNVTSSPPTHLQLCYQLDMVAGNATLYSKSLCNMRNIEAWSL